MRRTSGVANFRFSHETPNYRKYVHQEGNQQFTVYLPHNIGLYRNNANLPMIVAVEDECNENIVPFSPCDPEPQTTPIKHTHNLLTAILQELRKQNTKTPRKTVAKKRTSKRRR